ncbi:hypothetical protein ACQPZF_09785 [Actinosynnema sp. CS-041913]|uniref:hypothetical protein n=1 Tax=Actinosynnema sp. CS-041913 TaxID=3239917 RepID=UPI003D8E1C1A
MPQLTRLVWVLAIDYAGLMALTLWQALRGQPLFRPDLITTVGAMTLAAVTGVAATWALRDTDRTKEPAPA